MLSLITAIVKPHVVDPVKEALKGAGVKGMTITEVKGFGRQGGHTETYRGAEYAIDFVPKFKVEVLTTTSEVDSLMTLIATASNSGKIGDGKIWVTAVDRLVRVRTNERDQEAL